MDIGRNLISVKFSKILRLVKSSKFFRRRVDNSGNLRLIDFGGFPRFQFGVKVVYYRAFLFAMTGIK